MEANKVTHRPRHPVGVVHQFLRDTMNTKLLANKINDLFISLTDHFTALTRDSPPSLVPQELLSPTRKCSDPAVQHESFSGNFTPDVFRWFLSISVTF